jgi:hypothetical protein
VNQFSSLVCGCPNHIVPSAERETRDQVQSNYSPESWNGVNGFKFSVMLFGEHLDLLTNIAFLDPLFNILLHTWPTIMGPGGEEGSLATRMGCRWIIMMEFKDGASCGFREIDFAVKTPEILLFGPAELGPLSFL